MRAMTMMEELSYRSKIGDKENSKKLIALQAKR